MSSTTQRPTRRIVLAVGTASLLGAFAASPAFATPVSGSGNGPGFSTEEVDQSTLPPAQLIKSLRSSIDPVTGAWTATITFKGPQTAANASAFTLLATFADDSHASVSWRGSTAPGAPAPVTGAASAGAAQAGSAPAATVTQNSDNTALTFRTTDPSLVGSKPDTVVASLAAPSNGSGPSGQRSVATAFLGQKAPESVIPTSVRSLVVRLSRVVKVPLSPLARPASRTVTITMPGGRKVVGSTLAAKYYRRTSITMRVLPKSFRQISTRSHAATLKVRTFLDNGSSTSTQRTVRLRRR